MIRDRSLEPEELHATQQALWRRMRDISPPEGARQRVLEAIEPRLGSRWQWSVAIAPVAAAAAIAVLVLWWTRGPDPVPSGPLVVAASGVERDGERIVGGEVLAGGAIRVAEAGQLVFETEAAHVTLSGPADVELGDGPVVLGRGQLSVDGQLEVHGPGCRARIDGRSAVSVTPARLEVRVFAGSAEVSRPSASCEIIDVSNALEAKATDSARPAAPEPVASQPRPQADELGAEGAAAKGAAAEGDKADEPKTPAGSRRSPKVAPRPAAPQPSALSRQVDAYWAAVGLRKRDPVRALGDFRTILATWPTSHLRPEIELAIFDTLVILGRDREARHQAGAILRRDPSTPRARELERAAGASPEADESGEANDPGPEAGGTP